MSSTARPDNADREAQQAEFLLLLLPLRDRLARYARAVARTREDADDLVSDTIVDALEGFNRLRNREAFASYLFRIASRLHKRRQWRRKLFGDYDDARAQAVQSQGVSPETAADIATLYRALDELPAAQREAVVLFEISGLSLEEIRIIQGGSISGVKTRISRGRRSLAGLLDAQPQSAPKNVNAFESSTDSVAREIAPHVEAQLVYSRTQING